MIRFLKAATGEHFKTIEILANTIWREHYIPIIGKPQVDYMLDKFQSAKTIEQQVSEGYQYYMLMFENEYVGYLSIKKENQNLFLSKLYILKSERGKGFGKTAMLFIENEAKNLGCNSISLTVNKGNINSINTYENLGFENLGDILIDIGNGFVMDDFKMWKQLI